MTASMPGWTRSAKPTKGFPSAAIPATPPRTHCVLRELFWITSTRRTPRWRNSTKPAKLIRKTLPHGNQLANYYGCIAAPSQKPLMHYAKAIELDPRWNPSISITLATTVYLFLQGRQGILPHQRAAGL